jgi:hypothetical protein
MWSGSIVASAANRWLASYSPIVCPPSLSLRRRVAREEQARR